MWEFTPPVLLSFLHNSKRSRSANSRTHSFLISNTSVVLVGLEVYLYIGCRHKPHSQTECSGSWPLCEATTWELNVAALRSVCVWDATSPTTLQLLLFHTQLSPTVFNYPWLVARGSFRRNPVLPHWHQQSFPSRAGFLIVRKHPQIALKFQQ